MKAKTFFVLLFLFTFSNLALAQVEGVEVEKPKEEKKEREKKNNKDDGEEEEMMLRDRIFFGGNFGATFGTVTLVDISPMVGYRVTSRFSVGLGASYLYINDQRFAFNEPQSVYGGRLFTRYDIVRGFLGAGNLFAHAEYESLNAREYFRDSNTGLILERRKWFSSPFIGGGIAFPIGNRSAFTMMALYNPIYDEANSLYGSPLQIRIGGFF